MLENDVSQGRLIEKINVYINKYNESHSPKRELLNSIGVCSGLVGLFMCDSDKLYGQLKILDLFQYPHELFNGTVEEIYKDLIRYQSPDKEWPDIRQYEVDKISDNIGKTKFNHEFSLSFMLKLEEVNFVLSKMGESNLLNNSFVRIDSHNHSIVIKCTKEWYHLYNPNWKDFNMVKTNNFEILSTFIKSSYQDIYGDIPTPIAIDIYPNPNNQTEKKEYPNKQVLIAEIFEKRGNDWHSDLINGMDKITAIHLPARRGDTETIQAIFAAARKQNDFTSLISLFRKNEKGRTPAHEAAENGHLDVIQLFVNEGFSVSAANIDGNTPLHFAVNYPHYKTSIALISLLADNTPINSSNDKQQTALHWASTPEICELLILKGANIDLQDFEGYTPLHTAIDAGDVGVVKVLLNHNACMDLTATVDGKKLTPLGLAEKLMNDHPDKKEYKQIFEDLKAPRNTSTVSMTFHK